MSSQKYPDFEKRMCKRRSLTSSIDGATICERTELAWQEPTMQTFHSIELFKKTKKKKFMAKKSRSYMGPVSVGSVGSVDPTAFENCKLKMQKKANFRYLGVNFRASYPMDFGCLRGPCNLMLFFSKTVFIFS